MTTMLGTLNAMDRDRYAKRVRDLEHTLACARAFVAPAAPHRGVVDGYQDAAISLLSEIDALLKGTIYERPREESELT